MSKTPLTPSSAGAPGATASCQVSTSTGSALAAVTVVASTATTAKFLIQAFFKIPLYWAKSMVKAPRVSLIIYHTFL